MCFSGVGCVARDANGAVRGGSNTGLYGDFFAVIDELDADDSIRFNGDTLPTRLQVCNSVLGVSAKQFVLTKHLCPCDARVSLCTSGHLLPT